jgi:UDP-N-acetylmuramate--alanine ligase
MFRKIKAIHFVGIGGSGMSGIAEVVLHSGYTVTGSDVAANTAIERLKSLGARIYVGHNPENILGAEVIVTSTAIQADNPEVVAARYRNIPIIPRAEMLAEIMRMKYGIAVAGAHGKTSTTSMLALILSDSGLDPTVIIGGRLNSFDSNARLGKGPLMVAEADESDGSFLKLSPTISIVTNLDEEHLDFYQGGMPQIEETFLAFMNKVPFFGLVVLCTDDPRLAQLRSRVTRKVVTYGLQGGSDISAANIRSTGFGMSFELMVRGSGLGPVELQVPGLHNVQNSLAAIAVGLEFDVPMEKIREALFKFTGADRRFHRIGEARGRLIFDDYAHHPTEIKATLAAARLCQPKRLVAIFQPHRYTRFRNCWQGFKSALLDADHVVVVPVYPAGEQPLAGITAQAFFEELAETHPSCSYCDPLDSLASHLEQHSAPGDLILGLGAGSISQAVRKACDQLAKTQPGPVAGEVAP